MKSKVFGLISENSKSQVKICPILSANVTVFISSSSSSSLKTLFFLVIQPYGKGLVMAIPYWLFSSILIFFEENLFSWPSTVLKRTFSFFVSLRKRSVSNIIPVSNISLCQISFTQLYPPIKVFSNTLTIFALVGRATQHLLLSLWTQPEKLLALLHFLPLNLKSF